MRPLCDRDGAGQKWHHLLIMSEHRQNTNVVPATKYQTCPSLAKWEIAGWFLPFIFFIFLNKRQPKPKPYESFLTQFLITCTSLTAMSCNPNTVNYRCIPGGLCMEGIDKLKPEQKSLRKARIICIFKVLTKILIQNRFLELIFSHSGFCGKRPFSSVPRENYFCEMQNKQVDYGSSVKYLLEEEACFQGI